MRWSEFAQKQCVDLMNGEKLGDFYDLELDIRSGKIESVVVPLKKKWFKNKDNLKVKWSMIRKVGSEMIIVDTNTQKEHMKSV